MAFSERKWVGFNAARFAHKDALVPLPMTALVNSREAVVRYEAGDVDRSTRARNNFAKMYVQ